jgi:HicB-like protein involved in pilus formation
MTLPGTDGRDYTNRFAEQRVFGRYLRLMAGQGPEARGANPKCAKEPNRGYLYNSRPLKAAYKRSSVEEFKPTSNLTKNRECSKQGRMIEIILAIMIASAHIDRMKNLIVRLPDELHRGFKVKCAQEGQSMNTLVSAWIESYVKGSDRPKTTKKK